jgi:hypothetical protein
MENFLIKKQPLLEAIKLATETGADFFDFKSGILSAGDEGNFIVTAKTGIECFTGMFDEYQFQIFRKCVEYYRTPTFKIGVTSDQLFFSFRKTNETYLNYQKGRGRLNRFHLWDPKIEWQVCPPDFFEGLRMASDDVFNFKCFKNNQDRLIFISGKYLYYENCGALLRYRLQSPFIIDMALPKKVISKALTKINPSKRVRVAIYDIPNSDYNGMAFDLGDIRVLLPKVFNKEDNDKSNSSWKKALPLVESFYSSQTVFLVKIPDRFKNISKIYKQAKFYQNWYVEVEIKRKKKEKGLMKFKIHTNDYISTNKIPVIIYGPLKSVSFQMNLVPFSLIAQQGGLLGSISINEYNNKDMKVYLKVGKCEYQLTVSNYNQLI